MDCLFCKIIKGDIPSYKVYEDKDVFCFLDINPMSNGHILVIPKKHFVDINDIESLYLLKVHEVAKKMVTLVNEKLNPPGVRLVQNNGNIQAIKHYHLHVIPCYKRNNKKDVEEIYNILTK